MKNIPRIAKSLIVAFTIVGFICGGIYAMDDRYVSDAEAAQSLEGFDAKIQQSILKINIQILELRKEGLNKEYYQHKRLIRTYPDDKELVQELIEIKHQRYVVDEELRELIK